MAGFLLAAIVLLGGLTTAGSSGTAPAAASSTCRNGLVTVERDPRKLLPLTTNAVGLAAAAALKREPRKTKTKPIVVRSGLATADHEWGSSAKVGCGRRVWQRTVVVLITLRAFTNSASLSQRVDFVGRFKDGYHVWQVVH